MLVATTCKYMYLAPFSRPQAPIVCVMRRARPRRRAVGDQRRAGAVQILQIFDRGLRRFGRDLLAQNGPCLLRPGGGRDQREVGQQIVADKPAADGGGIGVAAVIEAAAHEQHRIGHDLHDGLGSYLAGFVLASALAAAPVRK